MTDPNRPHRPPLSRELQRAVRRHADQTSDRIADTPTTGFYANVTGLSPLTVQWHGSEFQASGKGAAYTPGLGDRVACMMIGPTVFVIDRSTPP